MKRFLAVAIVATMGLFYAGTSNAATGTMAVATPTSADVSGTGYAVGDTANGVVQSRHNLGAFGSHLTTMDQDTASATFGRVTGTTQICVFCHTPHHTEATNAGPLWNRGLSTTSANLTPYGTTLGGTTIAASDVSGTTFACLSCHDGVTTLDNLVNAPGNGGVTAGGASQGWTLFDEGAPLGTGLHVNTLFGTRVDIGQDLSNDHPIGVNYVTSQTAGLASLRAPGTTIADIDLSSGLSSASLADTTLFGWMQQNRWDVNGKISSTGTISDLLRNSKVECVSCHDPHFSNRSYPDYKHDTAGATFLTGVGQSDGLFLRRVGGNTGSGVCRTCHDK